jgi:hypothetical protein
LIVSTDRDCRPLLASRLFVVGWCGGGKSGFRRVHPLLHGLLKHATAHPGREIANPFFASGNPLAIRGVG